MRHALLILLVFLLAACGDAPAQDSGGPLLPEQAAYDVTFYDLDVQVWPGEQRIEGELVAQADVVEPLHYFVLQLDHRLTVSRVRLRGDGGRWSPAKVERRTGGNQLWIALPRTYEAGERIVAEVRYGGTPRTAPNPPWIGGFTWDHTPSGAPWIATSCQTAGPDIWWPAKDHPSDEPDSMAIRITVPDSLVAASNGRLRSVTHPAPGWRSYQWFVSTPINNYGVALNIAPYATIDTSYASVSGDSIPVSFFVLPSEKRKARRVLPDLLDQVHFLEETLRPYPFAADKYGIARTPFLGMEHQTIIAHGAPLGGDNALGYHAGFDALHFHELAHEWFGNFVTARDWKDFWIHEGFATYLEALYAEHLRGTEGYRAAIAHFREEISGQAPIARHEPTSALSIYSRDIYYKGAMVLHTLRYLIGDDAFFAALRRMAGANRSAPRLVDTQDFIRIAERASGQQLDWFFDTYLYQAKLPRLITKQEGDTLTLRWKAPGGNPFPMPIEVRQGGAVRRVQMRDGTATVQLEGGSIPVVDPERWVLRAE